MSDWALLFRELRHRALGASLVVLSVLVAVALVVAFQTSSTAVQRETARRMRDLGTNLVVLAGPADPAEYFARGQPSVTMPEESLDRLAEARGLLYRHMIAMLHHELVVDGVEVVLTGLSAERSPPGVNKPPMFAPVAVGTAIAGARVAEALGLATGDSLELLGREFEIAAVLAAKGTGRDDVRVSLHLADLQQLLDLEGQIHEIQALECFCEDPSLDVLELLQTQLAGVLPDAQVVQRTTLAQTRAGQRRLALETFSLQLPWVIVAAAVAVCVLGVLETRTRRGELAVLRALGRSSGAIAALILGKSLLLGAFGGALGWGVGTVAVLWGGADVFELTAKSLGPEVSLLLPAMGLSALFAAICAAIPAAWAVVQDPAQVLAEEWGP